VVVSIVVIVLCGCGPNHPPQYTLIGVEKVGFSAVNRAIPVEHGGWEFRFPGRYNIRRVKIQSEGKLTASKFSARKDEVWEPVKAERTDSTSTPVFRLTATTDAIRVFPEFKGKGRLILCEFEVAEPQRTLSIPLEKPPFIK